MDLPQAVRLCSRIAKDSPGVGFLWEEGTIRVVYGSSFCSLTESGQTGFAAWRRMPLRARVRQRQIQLRCGLCGGPADPELVVFDGQPSSRCLPCARREAANDLAEVLGLGTRV